MIGITPVVLAADGWTFGQKAGVLHGENEPLLAGTRWMWNAPGGLSRWTYEFRAGGRLIEQRWFDGRRESTFTYSWDREENNVRVATDTGWVWLEGKYCPRTRTITLKEKGGYTVTWAPEGSARRE
ncbi:MAG: hypothetical protein LBG76_09770 [Treponema sp.]|jgi:hypothetical protein|nr:hypothetical protein [Treponema sp.]